MRFSKVGFLMASVLVSASSLGFMDALAQDQDRDRVQDRVQLPDQDRTRDRLHDQVNTPSTSSSGTGSPAQYGPNNVYGWQLMTAQERATYQNEMRNATTSQERDRIQAQHHEEMQQRARSRNMLLPGMSGTRSNVGTGMRGTGGMGGGMQGGGRGGR